MGGVVDGQVLTPPRLRAVVLAAGCRVRQVVLHWRHPRACTARGRGQSSPTRTRGRDGSSDWAVSGGEEGTRTAYAIILPHLLDSLPPASLLLRGRGPQPPRGAQGPGRRGGRASVAPRAGTLPEGRLRQAAGCGGGEPGGDDARIKRAANGPRSE